MTNRGPGPGREEFDELAELADKIAEVIETRCANTAAAMQILCLVKYRIAGRARGREWEVVAEYETADRFAREGFELAAAVGFDAGTISGGGDA